MIMSIVWFVIGCFVSFMIGRVIAQIKATKEIEKIHKNHARYVEEMQDRYSKLIAHLREGTQ
jgi:uncharacterized membrane protein